MTSPIGPYTPAIRSGDWVIVSGQIGLGPDGLADGFANQLRQALENLRPNLASQGATLSQVVKTTVFLVHMTDFDELNRLYVEFFSAHAGDHRPARSAVAVAGLPLRALVEIEAWAHAVG